MTESHSKPRAVLPRHVAVVMDGNGRWAKKRFLPRLAGHSQGIESVRAVIRAAYQAGVQELTLFAFSSENWKRPQDEVMGLMSLFVRSLQKEIPGLKEQGIHVRMVGDLTKFPEDLQIEIRKAHAMTANCSRMKLNICVNYGSRWEIVEAARALIREQLSPDELTEERFSSKLLLSDVDLFIRTSGEERISNFLLWQLAYSELYFTDVLWPDFREKEFEQALDWFAGRERRFGKTSEQLKIQKDNE